MSAERTLWKYLCKGLSGRWHAQRHEDKYSSGIPDVSYAVQGTDGWIELKAASRPKRGGKISTGVSIEQSLWLTLRGREGNGKCFVLLRLDEEHFLFPWSVSRSLVEKQDYEDLCALSVARWGKGVDFEELLYELRGRS